MKITKIFDKPFFSRYNVTFLLWLLMAVVAWVMKFPRNSFNNFKIFTGVFRHTIEQSPLYITYPKEYFDSNHYGPLFSIIVAPFALIPEWAGLLSWLLLSSILAYIAVKHLPIDKKSHIFIYWFCAHELLTALFMSQFNIAIAGMILLAFAFIRKEKDIWAALMIVIGTMVKLYGIVGFAFFFFSKHKYKLIIWTAIWGVIMFVLPMIISSPEFIVSQYGEWFSSISEKNALNNMALMQNISFLGMIRKISGDTGYSDLPIIITGILIFGIPYLRFKQYKNTKFQLFILASTLLFTVLFSTGSESSSYIIALIGVAIWYTSANWQRSRLDLVLIIFAFILSSMSPSDLFPKYIRDNWVIPYALKALPCFLIWVKLIYELIKYDFTNKEQNTNY